MGPMPRPLRRSSTPDGAVLAALTLALLGAALCPAPAAAQTGEAPAAPSAATTAAEPAPWWGGATLLGDLGGLRPRLRDLGITPTLSWVSDVQGNPIGGERRGAREVENWGLEVAAD